MSIQDLIGVLIGGGGVAILTALWKVVKEVREGRVMRDDTAITRWKDIADEYQDRAEAMQHEIDWYRATYAELRAAYVALPPVDKQTFPSVPPPPPRGDTPTK